MASCVASLWIVCVHSKLFPYLQFQPCTIFLFVSTQGSKQRASRNRIQLFTSMRLGFSSFKIFWILLLVSVREAKVFRNFSRENGARSYPVRRQRVTSSLSVSWMRQSHVNHETNGIVFIPNTQTGNRTLLPLLLPSNKTLCLLDGVYY